jgi:hypothetical protein
MPRKLLIDHAIAGTYHAVDADYLASLDEGEPLRLVREPTNKYDPHAVRIDHGEQKLGYVPALYSQMVSALIDSKLVRLTATVGDTITPKKALVHFQLWLDVP